MAAGKAIAALCAIALYYVVLSRPSGPDGSRGLTPEQAAELSGRVVELMRTGRNQEALAPALKLMREFPSNPPYIERVAELYSRLNRPAQEAETWEHYLLNAPRPIEACPQIGKAYEKQGRMNDAVGAYERCLALDPESVDTYVALAHAFELQARTAEAEARYVQASKLAPQNPDIDLGFARIALRRGKTVEALDRGTRVIARYPGYADAMYVLGVAKWRLGKSVEAKHWLTQGFEISRRDPDFPAFLGRIAEAERNYPAALSYYNRALELAPQYREVASLRDSLQARAR